MVAASSSSSSPSSSSSYTPPVSMRILRVVKTFVFAAGILLFSIKQYNLIQQAGVVRYLQEGEGGDANTVSAKKIGFGSGNTIQWENRDYITHPVTAKESSYITNMTIADAKRRTERSRPLKVAVCHPTMFGGNLSLDPFFAWVSYYRLLGFDHIFLWYEDNIATRPRFAEFQALPYVTLTLYSNDKSTTYHGQQIVERECFVMANRSRFDWALPIDVDEFIWFEEQQSIQDFLSRFEEQKITYVSLGKHHYSTRHVYNGTMKRPDDAGEWFGLQQYPYTPGPYCYGNPGSSNCPTWIGRSKVLARPSQFESVQIHGVGHHNARDGSGTHLDTSVAHFKEWVFLTKRHEAGDENHNNDTISHNDTQPFSSSTSDDAGIYWLTQSHAVNEAGQVTMNHDGHNLHEWFRFVAQGAVVATKTSQEQPEHQLPSPSTQSSSRRLK